MKFFQDMTKVIFLTQTTSALDMVSGCNESSINYPIFIP
jgi:hypothetical protein